MSRYTIWAPAKAIPDWAAMPADGGPDNPASLALRSLWRGRSLREWEGEPCPFCADGSEVSLTTRYKGGQPRTTVSWPDMEVAAEGSGWRERAGNLAAALDSYIPGTWPRDWRCRHKDAALAMRDRVKARMAVADWEWRRGG